MRPKDVMAFVTAQRRPKPGAENVVRIDGSAGLSAATIKRRLAAVSSFYGYLITRDDVAVTANPVPRGIATRQSRSRSGRGLPLVRGVRRLPRILELDEIDALMGALRTERDRAMTQAMVLGGLRRCEVLGLRLGDLRLGEWRVLIREGKGGHERSGAAVAHLLFHRGALHGPRATRDDERVALRRPQRSASRPSALGARPRPDHQSRPGARPVSPTAPVTSCATPASRVCARPAWPSKPSRPRPDTARSPRPGSISTSASTGWPTSTAAPRSHRGPGARGGGPMNALAQIQSSNHGDEAAGRPRSRGPRSPPGPRSWSPPWPPTWTNSRSRPVRALWRQPS